ncbi:MAG: NUDIX hydrolase [Bacilli bacterium]|nr:NUDIX hydrolase [Bacilli bacterium]
MYSSEEEFLAHYDPSKYERLSMSTDIIIFSVSDILKDNYRKVNDKIMSILLVKRDNYPFKDRWCLPGGFLDPKKETLLETAKRVLKNETNLDNIYLEQLYTFDCINRDPRMRVLSTTFMALIDKNQLLNIINEKASWFNIVDVINNDNLVTITLDNGEETLKFSVKKTLLSKTTHNYEYHKEKSVLAFDHESVIACGMDRIRNKVKDTDIIFNLLPKYFTLGELQRNYEVILGKKLLDPAFRRIIKDKVVKTDKIRSDGGHRPSILYEYKENIK